MNTLAIRIKEYSKQAGARYWTASLLPAITGTTLPFWLNPPGFNFKLSDALFFLIATVTCHAGFSLLYYSFNDKFSSSREKSRFIASGIIHLIIAVITGLYLNSHLHLHKNVPDYIFVVYGVTTIFAGILYVTPLFNFSKKFGGETVLSVGLGMLPVLGAYIVQVGDLTRTVYLASLPIVISTALWVWITELISKEEDENSGYKTTVMYFPFSVSCRIVTPILIISLYGALILSVWGRSSLNPFSLAGLFSILLAIKIINITRSVEIEKELQKAEKYAMLIHLSVCIIIISSFLSVF